MLRSVRAALLALAGFVAGGCVQVWDTWFRSPASRAQQSGSASGRRPAGCRTTSVTSRLPPSHDSGRLLLRLQMACRYGALIVFVGRNRAALPAVAAQPAAAPRASLHACHRHMTAAGSGTADQWAWQQFQQAQHISTERGEAGQACQMGWAVPPLRFQRHVAFGSVTSRLPPSHDSGRLLLRLQMACRYGALNVFVGLGAAAPSRSSAAAV